MKLYIANKNYSSWSLRPWLLLRELGIAFEEKLVWFGGDVPFKSFSPSGTVPCLHDGDTVIWDSLAITEYLAERNDRVWPRDAKARAWARCAAAEMHSGFGVLRDVCSMNIGVRIKLHAIKPELQKDLDRISELWKDGLARFGGPFLAGREFCAADAFFGPVAFRIQTFGLQLDPAAMAYAQRLLAVPAMRAWQEAALAETLRDQPHEDEIPKHGKLIEDLRA